MKASDLLKQINYVAQVMSKNPVIPVLECILFDNGYLIASDFETYIVVKTEVVGTFCVCKDDLKKILSKLPKGASVSISVIENGTKVAISVDGTRNTFKLPLWTEEGYPKIPSGKMDWIGNLTAEDTVKISEYVPVASTDELKPAMNCIYVSDEIAATDGHILFWNKTKGKINTPVLFNKRVAKIASSLGACKVQLIPSNKEDESDYIRVSNEETQVIFRNINEAFPGYKNAIPVGASVVVKLDHEKLYEQINNALIAANKITHAIRFTFSKDSDLKIFSEDLDFGSEYNGELGCEFHSDVEDIFTIGFNGKLLLDVIGRLETDQLTLRMSAPSRACIINDCCLIMPIMLIEYTV